LNKKSAQKQKRHLKTTASRKPLFQKKKSSKLQTKPSKLKPNKTRNSQVGLYFYSSYAYLLAMNHGSQSILISGLEGILIEIECQLSNGLPSIVIVGLGNKAIDEAKERIRSAFASTKLNMPRKRITINLAPADIPKESTSLDLAIAAAIMIAASQDNQQFIDTVLIGEVGLNGDVRPVRGIIGKIIAASRLGVKSFIVPKANLSQAALVPGATIYPVENIKDLFLHLHKEKMLVAASAETTKRIVAQPPSLSFSSIAGQQQAKRSLEIAAAGGHNILLCGPPGTGKSMLAKAMPGILPPLSLQEILEVTHLHSLASFKYDKLVTHRPFRAPHHSASNVAIVGGGNNVLPGEITLSHRGVLFMDELPEFGRQTIEALRQPLEDNVITIARAKKTIEYPANFIMIATANPCPCGYYGSDKECICTPAKIQQYQRKLSGPILDRIDLFVQVEAVDHTLLLANSSDEVEEEKRRQRILKARSIQAKRLKSTERLNAAMTNEQVKMSPISKDATTLLNQAAKTLSLSPRGYMRVIKVSRTIADLVSSDRIEASHISEALQYRELRMIYQ
jgi:magnesium chelatase family protein